MIDTKPVIGVKRPNLMAIQSLLAPAADTTPDNRAFNYRELDPYLSLDQESDYQQCESIWLDVMRKARDQASSDSTISPKLKPTFQQFEALRHLLDQRPDLKLKVLPSSKKKVRLQEGYTKISPKENKPVISFYLPNPYDPDDIANSFSTLSHELVHALHFSRSSIQPRERRANYDLCTSRLETLIEQHNNVKPNWTAIFNQDNILQYEINRLPAKSLGALKLKLMTEAIAYQLSCPDYTSNSFDYRMAEGYKAAIRFVNSALDAKQQTNSNLQRLGKRRRLLENNVPNYPHQAVLPATSPGLNTPENYNHNAGLPFYTANNLPRFSSSDVYYRNLDPKLTSHQIHSYHAFDNNGEPL